MPYDIIYFDLDSTLYPESNGLWADIRKRIDSYMKDRMDFHPDEIPAIRNEFFMHHGTTLRGLQIHYNVDPIDYLEYVHDLPLKNYLTPDPLLREILLSIPGHRWVFTNADAHHANRVMSILGIRDCFEGMIDILMMDPLCKPKDEAYNFALDFAGAADPKLCALLDDSIRNLAPAKGLGFFTVLVGSNDNHSEADRSLVDIHDLPQYVPEFWF